MDFSNWGGQKLSGDSDDDGGDGGGSLHRSNTLTQTRLTDHIQHWRPEISVLSTVCSGLRDEVSELVREHNYYYNVLFTTNKTNHGLDIDNDYITCIM